MKNIESMDNYIDVIKKNYQDMWNSRMFLCGNISYNKLLSVFGRLNIVKWKLI